MRRQINRFAQVTAALSILTSGGFALAAPVEPVAGGTSEHDYFSDLPVVLSVSRLAQPLDETPGAVTVIDRDMIRRSGARELVDILRLVPGFIIGGFNGANPLAAYHAGFDDNISRHLQILVDGRSVYSSFLLGDTHRGMMGVVLEDIERIEVLRGSNSAAYGANAFLGVINIITRNALDARGGMMSVTAGERGIDDNMVRVGVGNDRAAIRATLARRADSGLDHLYDDKRVEQLHLRADFRPGGGDEISLSAGKFVDSYGDGFPNESGNMPRTSQFGGDYLQGSWRRDLGQGRNLQVLATLDNERIRDNFPYPLLDGLVIDFGGTARRTSIQAQHSFSPGANVRAVWGGEYRHESVNSKPVYFVDEDLTSHQWRWFGNAEWRPHHRLLINAGGLWEYHSIVGARMSPRLMANVRVANGHTIRAGITEAHRSPTLYELRGDVRYYHPTLGVLLANTVKATGGVKPETMLVRELGYLGEFPKARLMIDVRAFDERIDTLVGSHTYAKLGLLKKDTDDMVNKPGPRILGWEHQTTWRPTSGTRIILSQQFSRIDSAETNERHNAPTDTTALAWFQDLPGNLSASLMYATTGAMTWRGYPANLLKSEHQLDLRLAWKFRVGTTRGELAGTVQQANGPRQELLPTYTLDRRAYATLRLEF
ncbi:MAG: TonB-dependent receptor [Sulfurisoma sp.]|nr:TonB-dependent receptor [Sulfurisoma sp.]